MSAKKPADTTPRPGRSAPGANSTACLRGIIRVRPETWREVAALRRAILDSEGNRLGLESFDRVVRRLLNERSDAAPRRSGAAGQEVAKPRGP
jgi:hypothetical protein